MPNAHGQSEKEIRNQKEEQKGPHVGLFPAPYVGRNRPNPSGPLQQCRRQRRSRWLGVVVLTFSFLNFTTLHHLLTVFVSTNTWLYQLQAPPPLRNYISKMPPKRRNVYGKKSKGGLAYKKGDYIEVS